MFPLQEKNIIIRKAEEKDTDLIFSFINENEIRKQSFNSNKIEYPVHLEWFKEKINSDDYLILVAEEKDTGEFLGEIKYNRLDSKSILVGIFVNKKFAGKGLGAKLLQLTTKPALQYFNTEEILAQIKKDNIPSIKAFTKAGYLFERETIIMDSNAVEMIYKTEVK